MQFNWNVILYSHKIAAPLVPPKWNHFRLVGYNNSDYMVLYFLSLAKTQLKIIIYLQMEAILGTWPWNMLMKFLWTWQWSPSSVLMSLPQSSLLLSPYSIVYHFSHVTLQKGILFCFSDSADCGRMWWTWPLLRTQIYHVHQMCTCTQKLEWKTTGDFWALERVLSLCSMLLTCYD